MLSRHLILGLALFCTTPLSSRADVLIYKTFARVQTVGAGLSERHDQAGYVVWDADSDRIVILVHALQDPAQTLRIGTNRQQRFTLMGSRGLTYTILANASSTTNDAGSLSLIANFTRGNNSHLRINTNRTVSLPSSFHGSGRSLVGNTITQKLVETTVDYAFLGRQTRASNARGATFEQAVARLQTELEARGFHLRNVQSNDNSLEVYLGAEMQRLPFPGSFHFPQPPPIPSTSHTPTNFLNSGE